MYGAMEFYYAAREHGLTPILGCEAYIAPRGRLRPHGPRRGARHAAGGRLGRLPKSHRAGLEGLPRRLLLQAADRPRVAGAAQRRPDRALGLHVGPRCRAAAAGRLRDGASQREDVSRDLRRRFYIEVMRHGMPEQDTINEGLVRVARELGVPIVATNDSHYLEQKDAARARRAALHRHGKDRLGHEPDAVLLRRVLSEDGTRRCASFGPTFRRPATTPSRSSNASTSGSPRRSSTCRSIRCRRTPAAPEKSDAEYLRELCERGLIERYGEERVAGDAPLRERLDYELDVIMTMGFSSYFLIVWDFVKYARDRGIPVGPGRGSAVGSLVSYCLRITDLDPLRFNLLFERFLNPERISMPDIDTDFCVERRDEVIEYVTEKYGKDRVAQIVTFGTMAARAAIRDAGRALGVPLPDVDRVAKLVPGGPGGMPIAQAIEQIAELRSLYATRPQIRKLLDTAKQIEGLGAQREHARGGRRDLGGSADRLYAARSLRRRRHQHAVRHGLDRAHRPAEDGFPRAAQPHGHGERRGGDPAHARREFRPHDDPVRRPADVRDARPRRNDGRLPAGVRRDEARLRRASSRRGSKTSSRWSRSTGPARWTGFRSTSPTSTAARSRSTCTRSSSRSSTETYGIAGLSGAGHADGARHRRLLDGRSRRAAQGHGQEAEGEDPASITRNSSTGAIATSGIDRALAERLFHSSSRLRDTASTSRTRPRTHGSRIRLRTSRRTIRCSTSRR